MAAKEKVKQNNKHPMDNSRTFANEKENTDNENEAGEKEHIIEKKLLSLEQIDVLLELTVEDLESQLAEILRFNYRQICLKETALLDYFVSGFWWAKEMNFSCQQISSIMTLLQMLLDNIREKQMPLVDNYIEFTKAMTGMTQRPSSGENAGPLFDVDQACSVTDYFKTSLFQPYKLYEFLFTHPREELLLAVEETIEVISSRDYAAPLEEGMPTDVFIRYLAPATHEGDRRVLSRIDLGEVGLGAVNLSAAIKQIAEIAKRVCHTVQKKKKFEEEAGFSCSGSWSCSENKSVSSPGGLQ